MPLLAEDLDKTVPPLIIKHTKIAACVWREEVTKSTEEDQYRPDSKEQGTPLLTFNNDMAPTLASLGLS